MDYHRGLIAPVGTCTCTCVAEGQSCATNTTLEIFNDMNCVTKCATVSSPPAECGPISGCTGSQGSLQAAAAPTPAGGSCAPNVVQPDPPAWTYDARICQPKSTRVCDAPEQVCAPKPQAPYYTTRGCVMSIVLEGDPVPACPAEYPKRRPTLYGGVTDGRRCTDCTCGSVSGGACAGSLTMTGTGNCSDGVVVTYELDDPCQAFNLGSGNIRPAHVRGDYVVTPGSCAVATASKGTGSAVESGPIAAVCCQE
jgi:hypothetical protein